jgi:hypothetical protein
VQQCPIERVTRILGGVHAALEDHNRDCGDRIVGIALHPDDHERLSIVELWGLPVLAWDLVEPGRLRLLCDATGTLIPPVDTYEDLIERWSYHLEVPPPA